MSRTTPDAGQRLEAIVRQLAVTPKKLKEPTAINITERYSLHSAQQSAPAPNEDPHAPARAQDERR